MDDADQDPRSLRRLDLAGIQNLVLAARGSGLGAVPTTYALAHRDELKSRLELPSRVRAQAVILVGLPVGRFGLVRRRPIDEVMMHDRWSGDLPHSDDSPAVPSERQAARRPVRDPGGAVVSVVPPG